MIKCINKDKKFSNLTVGKDYEGTVNGDFVEVTNDIGAKARYHKRYFEVETAVPTTRRNAPRVRPVIEVSMVEYIDQLLEMNVEDGEECSIECNIDHMVADIYVGRAINSCGVRYLDGLSAIMNLANSTVATFVHEGNNYRIRDLDRNQLFILILEAFIRTGNFSCAFIILSTAMGPENGMLTLLSMQSYCTTSPIRHNPNSGNDIAVWIVDMEHFVE